MRLRQKKPAAAPDQAMARGQWGSAKLMPGPVCALQALAGMKGVVHTVAEQPNGHVRIAAVGDLHCGKDCQGRLRPLFEQIAQSADVLVLCGDLTDHGTIEEAKALAHELSGGPTVPMLGVLGNHDHEAGQPHEVMRILAHAGITFLDGDPREVHGIGFVGVKGFAGGFGRATLSAFGEAAIKRFVQESIDEATKLEAGLARMTTERKVVILHYAPIVATIEGEPAEIWPYLGSSRLEEPINRHAVTTVVHGHAHKGTPEGRTSTGIPVYNVSIPVMRHRYPDRPPFRILDIPHVVDLTPPAPTQAPVESRVE
jgi:Icc-related predicted phosphoesterase